MSKRADVKRLAKTALEAFGRIDILVNNAGTNKPQAIDQIDDATWDEVLEINLSSVMALTRALVPQMKERRWGRIIHISSVMGFSPRRSATSTALPSRRCLAWPAPAPSTWDHSASPSTASRRGRS